MVLPGHIAGGYIAARAVLALGHASFTPGKTLALLTIGTLAGEAPDLDLIFFYFEQKSAKAKKIDNHRDYITHAPLVWLLLCLVISGIGFAAHSVFIEFLGMVILAGTWSHFIFDSIEDGVRWLWPFSDKAFCLHQTGGIHVSGQPGTFAYYWEFITKQYFKKWTFYAEIVVVIVGVYLLFR